MTENSTAAIAPWRLAAILVEEQCVLDALRAAYNAGEIDHLSFAPAWDATACRIAALAFAVKRAEKAG